MSYDDLPKTTKLDPIEPNGQPPKGRFPTWLLILGGGFLLCVIVACVVAAVGGTLFNRQLGTITESLQLTSTALSTDFATPKPAIPTENIPVTNTPRPNTQPTATATKSLGTTAPVLPTSAPTSPTTNDSGAIISTDGFYQIRNPGTMIENSTLNSQATLQIANLRAEKYLIVIPDNAQSLFDQGFTFEDYCDWIVDNFSTGIANSELTELGDLTIDNFPAKRYQLDGTLDDLKVTYFLTMINGGATYFQVVAWTLTDMLDENTDELLGATDSFQSFRNDQGQDQ